MSLRTGGPRVHSQPSPAEQPFSSDSQGTLDKGVALQIVGIKKHFRREGGEDVPAIDGISLTVHDGEMVVLLGPSGCGKTTLLRAVAGLEKPDEGLIVIDDRVVFSSSQKVNAPPEKRPVGMIFQSYALWPHMTVFEIVAYPLRSRKVPRREISDRVMGILETVDLAHLRDQHPGRLSGGQQQRVALARAIVAGDRVVLFDEPLSNVDAKVREHLRVELLAMQAKLGFSALYVTHDQEEALELGTRVAVLSTGKLMQIDSPQQIYEAPSSRYVAGFIGKLDEVSGTVTASTTDSVVVDTEMGAIEAVPAEAISVNDQVVLYWRHERLEITVTKPQHSGAVWPATIVAELYSGPLRHYILAVGGRQVRATRSSALPKSDAYWASLPPSAARAFLAETSIGTAGSPSTENTNHARERV